MKQPLLQLHQGFTVLKQPLKTEGLILLRPDGVQLEGGQMEGQPFGLGFVYRRAVQELVQFPAQPLCLRQGHNSRRRAGDALRVLNQEVQEAQHLFLSVLEVLAIFALCVLAGFYLQKLALTLGRSKKKEGNAPRNE